ncbi:MAG TPA: YdcF family protein [Gemmatimonadaceae bacterium]|nr:YdcF family protein [Gemmatimonadaceae bacterium]
MAAYVLGVQQLIRRPDIILYIPAALLGAALGVTRLRPLLWIGAGIIALICIVVAYTPVVSLLGRPLIRRDSIPAHVDAIAVLSNGFTPDGMMRGETLDRLLSGIMLARRGVAPAMLVSMERRAFNGAPVTDSVDLRTVTAVAGVATATTFVDSVTSTRTEALRMRAIARANGWTTLALVTSPLHTRRACATFEAVGFKVVCVPAALRGSGLYPGSNAEDRLRAFRSWLYERFATDSYRRRGWIP